MTTALAAAEENIAVSGIDSTVSENPIPVAQTVSETVADTPQVAPQVTPQVAAPAKAKDPKNVWIKTKYANLYRSGESDFYFVRAKVRGHQVRKSLRTKSVEVAKVKMDAFLAGERDRLYTKPDDSKVFVDFANEWIERAAVNPMLKPSTVQYRRDTLKLIEKSWPGVGNLRPDEFTDQSVGEWAFNLRTKYTTKRGGKLSPTRFNGVVQTMRSILQVMVDKKILRDNPAKGRKRNSNVGIPAAPVPVVPPELPSIEQFKKLLEKLDSIPERKHAAQMIRFLAYSGMRIGAARLIREQHIDLARNEIVVPAIKYEQAPHRIPMIPEMRELCKKLLFDYPGAGPIFPIADPRKALKNSCKEAGIAELTNHDMRHLFVTRCIESNIDVRTIAYFVGHRDNGALILKTYGHVRREHAQEMAAKINFGVDAEAKGEQV